jgi:hypothetical protein
MSSEEEMAVLWLNVLKMQATYNASKGEEISVEMLEHINILFSMLEELDEYRTQDLLKEHGGEG